jgi:tetratricopeptide (TPR) repeat protein
MGKRPVSRVRVAASILAFVGAAIAAYPVAADAQVHVGVAAESPQDALARNVKLLARSPRDFTALIGAGKAALALGDTAAAAGFFGRADEVWPTSPLPQAGMGAALVHEGQPAGALQYFARAVQRGATPLVIGAERGLAYDLLGQHALAQADYRAALAGPDRDEARRRLALSLAISGSRAEALSTLGPLMARGDAAAARCRAFVLALTGDRAGARAAIEAAMPGTSYRMDYFFARLPTLASPQKAAAVHLGIFPEVGAQVASAAPAYSQPVPSIAPPPAAADRLSAIDELLRRGAPSAGQAPLSSAQQAQPQQLATANVPRRPATESGAANGRAYAERRIWLQLASGADARAFEQEFERIKDRGREVMEGIDGYVAESGGRVRLLIGPFRNSDEAEIFARDLDTLRIDSFAWTNPPGQTIRKLSE